MTWNYRIAKHTFSYKENFKFNPELANKEDQTLYSIIEVYYDKDGNINGYIDDKNMLADWEELEDLKGTYELIKDAFEKPIVDLNQIKK